jgi:sugar lactone lactonase YvrE
VADTFGWRVRIFDSDLKFTGVEFGEPPASGSAPGPFSLFGPRDLAFDAEGNLWVTDTGHKRIQIYTAKGDFVRTIGKEGSGEGDFNEPVGISIGQDGTVLVADMYNRRVVMLDSSGVFQGQFAVDGWGGQEVTNKPYIEALEDGRIAVSLPASNQVRIYRRDGTLDATVGSAADPLSSPFGILQTADAKLWVVEGGVPRVRQFDLP